MRSKNNKCLTQSVPNKQISASTEALLKLSWLRSMLNRSSINLNLMKKKCVGIYVHLCLRKTCSYFPNRLLDLLETFWRNKNKELICLLVKIRENSICSKMQKHRQHSTEILQTGILNKVLLLVMELQEKGTQA